MVDGEEASLVVFDIWEQVPTDLGYCSSRASAGARLKKKKVEMEQLSASLFDQIGNTGEGRIHTAFVLCRDSFLVARQAIQRPEQGWGASPLML